MNALASSLSEGEILAAAHYLSTLTPAKQ
ncbi:cytochrome c4, partial [Pseudomonas sp. ATCC 13867]